MKLTRWNLSVVDSVLRGQLTIKWLDMRPYEVDSHAYTGGPVLRGPWGSKVGLQHQFDLYKNMCKEFIAANVHGQLHARRIMCEAAGECQVEGSNCQRCGGVVE